MIGYLLKKVGIAVVVLWAIISASFVIVRVAPGGPFDAGERDIPPEVRAKLMERYLLDRPIYEQTLPI